MGGSDTLPKYHSYSRGSGDDSGNNASNNNSENKPNQWVSKNTNSKYNNSKFYRLKSKTNGIFSSLFDFKDLNIKNLKNNTSSSTSSRNKTKFFKSLLKLLGLLILSIVFLKKIVIDVLLQNESSFSFKSFFLDFFDENDLSSSSNNLDVLHDPEYYNYDFRNLEVDTISKFDKGAKHYLITHEADIVTDADKLKLEDELEMLLASSVQKYDLKDFTGTPEGKENKEHLLLCVPLRNAENVLPLMFKHLMNLTYPHELIDLSFLVSDCSPDDKTLDTLLEYSKEMQNGTLSKVLEKIPHSPLEDELHLKYMNQDYLKKVKTAFSPPFHDDYNKPFRSIQIFQKDFGQVIGQGFNDRHAVKVQGVRRKLMGRARNWLLSNSLRPYHSWVYWRDVDVELCPGTVIEDLMKFDYDVVVPNVWRPLPTFLNSEQEYDLNSWIESGPALQLAKTLDEDDVIVEGYAEYPTYRVHLANLRRADGNPRDLIDLDGVGGVSILAKAKLFRSGINFPAFTFENHAETEAFGKLARKMGFRVGGLPHYTLWHIYEPSDDDLREMSIRERDGRRNG